MKVLVGCTGSVATIKIPEIVEQLMSRGFEVQVVATECAKHFLKDISMGAKIWSDENEWSMWNGRGDPVLHIELRKWADLLVISPLDANTLAKMAQGLCDNLLTCIVRAWDLDKPLLFCPAMNTHMWNHPLTQEHITKIKNFGYVEIPCISKTLMCGDTGPGAMADVLTIVDAVAKFDKNE